MRKVDAVILDRNYLIVWYDQTISTQVNSWTSQGVMTDLGIAEP